MAHIQKIVEYMPTNSEVKLAFNTWQRRDFEYGDSDCVAFVAHILTELHGRDFTSLITYNNEQEAEEIISDHGGFEELMDFYLGDPAEPQNGDPAMIELPKVGKMMGIVLEDTVVCVTKKGLAQFHKKYIIRGWQVWKQ